MAAAHNGALDLSAGRGSTDLGRGAWASLEVIKTFDRVRKVSFVMDETLVGFWSSIHGGCFIAREFFSKRLCFAEPLPDGRRLCGWLSRLERGGLSWQSALFPLASNELLSEIGGDKLRNPAGHILICLCLDGEIPLLEVRIRVAAVDEEWQEPVCFRRDVETLKKQLASKEKPRLLLGN